MNATRTFKDFFTDRFSLTRPLLKNFLEMSIPNFKEKNPVHIDEDDIQFLRQFPHEYWNDALQQRYNMLHKALVKLERQREGILEKTNLVQQIVKAIKTGHWEQISQIKWDEKPIFDANQIHDLQKQFSRNLTNIRDTDIEEEAKSISYEAIKDLDDNIEDQKEVDFEFKDNDYDFDQGKFKASNRSTKKKSIVAMPFLNRLYHKLERTKDHDHSLTSGLAGKGKYGYDLRSPEESPDPDKIPNVTAGMKFPIGTNISHRLREFWNYNQHRMFGDLPDDPDVDWRKTKNEDRVSRAAILEKFSDKIMSDPNFQRENEKLNKTAQVEKANELAKEEIIKAIENGQGFNGPPVPGKFPNGEPFKVETDSKGNKNIVAPGLWLPGKMQPIRVKKNGVEQSERHWVPLVNPAHFFRKVGSRSEDYATEEDPETGEVKRKFDANGNPIFNVDQSKLVGHNKDHLKVDDDDWRYGQRGENAGGSFQFNHQEGGRKQISKLNKNYGEAWEKVFGNQDKVNFDPKNQKLEPSKSGAYYKDVAVGIKQAANSAWGGATHVEIVAVWQNFDMFHAAVMDSMEEHLGDETLYDVKNSEGDVVSGPKQRVAFAKKETSLLLQLSQGEGSAPRKKRQRGDGGVASLDNSVDGSEGGSINVDLSDKAVDSDGNLLKSTLIGNRGKGDKLFYTGNSFGGQTLPYRLSNLRKALAELRTSASQADETASQAMARANAGNLLKNLLIKGIQDKTNVISTLTDILTTMYEPTMGAEAAKKKAEEEITGLVENGAKTSEELLNRFYTLDVAQQALNNLPQDSEQPKEQPKEQPTIAPVQKDGPISPEEQQAVDFLHSSLENMANNGKTLEDPLVKKMLMPERGSPFSVMARNIANQFGEPDRQKIMARVQAEIFKLLNKSVPSIKSQPIAAKQVAPHNISTPAQFEPEKPAQSSPMARAEMPKTASSPLMAFRRKQAENPPDEAATQGHLPLNNDFENWQDIKSKKYPNWKDTPIEQKSSEEKRDYALDHAFNQHYHDDDKSIKVDTLKKHLQMIHELKDTMEPHKYRSAVHHLMKTIAKREAQ